MKIAKIFLIVAFSFGFSSQIGAKMRASENSVSRPTKTLLTSTLIVSLEKKEKAKKISANEAEMLLLARMSDQALGLKSFRVVDSAQNLLPENDISTLILINEIHQQIRKSDHWSEHLEAGAKEMMTRNRGKLETLLSRDPLVWAWVEWQIDHKESAQKTLLSGFEKEFQKIMKLSRVDIGIDGQHPMYLAEETFEMLQKILPTNELEKVTKKMNQMKIHISKLPTSHMVT